MARELILNSTQIPDVILDFWLSELSGAELKVVLYVARRTYGFGKESDNISLNQLADGIRRRDGTTLDKGTGLSRSTVKTACSSLVKRKVLVKTTNVSETTREFEESTYRLNLQWTTPAEPKEPARRVGRKPAQVGRTTVEQVGRKSAIQETEDIQETAAEAGIQRTGAGAEIVKELVSHGMNRCDAIRLAAVDAEGCRQQLKFLCVRIQSGFVFTSGKGAFLRRAIEDGFAPPKGYEEARRAEVQSITEKAQSSAELALRTSKRNRLRKTLDRLETDQPGAYSAFTAYVEKKKLEAIDRPILKGAPEVRERLLQSFQSEETRLALLAEYLTDQPVS